MIGPVFNENGNIGRFVTLRTDITERKLAQIEKIKLGSLLTNVLDAASEMSIIATDKKGMITIFNRGAEQLLGYAAVDDDRAINTGTATFARGSRGKIG